MIWLFEIFLPINIKFDPLKEALIYPIEETKTWVDHDIKWRKQSFRKERI